MHVQAFLLMLTIIPVKDLLIVCSTLKDLILFDTSDNMGRIIHIKGYAILPEFYF